MPEESKFAGTLKRLRQAPEGTEGEAPQIVGSVPSDLSAALREALRPGLVADHHPYAKVRQAGSSPSS